MQTLETTLSSWGKSTALRIPTPLVKKAGLKIGQTVRFEDGANGSIILWPVMERPKLEDLLAQVTAENLPSEADVSWGKPQGTEAW